MQRRELQAVQWLVLVRVDVRGRSGDAPVVGRIHGQTSGKRVEDSPAIIEVRAYLVRMRPVEDRSLEVNLGTEKPQRRDAEALVRNVLRMMAERCGGVVDG